MARRRSRKPTGDEKVTPNAGATIGHEAELQTQQAEGARLDAAIAENLKALGFPLPQEER